MVLRIVTVVTAIIIVATLGWASLRYFRQSGSGGAKKRWYKSLIYSVIVLHVVAIVASPPPAIWILGIGETLAVVSLILFWAAVFAHGPQRPAYAFEQVDPASFVAKGPYRLIRHPFYLSFMLAALAGTFIAGQPLLLLTVATLATVYYRVARREEQSFGDTEFAQHYQQYRAVTGMFLPRLWRSRIARIGASSDQTRSPPQSPH